MHDMRRSVLTNMCFWNFWNEESDPKVCKSISKLIRLYYYKVIIDKVSNHDLIEGKRKNFEKF